MRGDLPFPVPGRSPDHTLRTVLDALETPDRPAPGSGVTTAFHFAAPEYRAGVGGGLSAFFTHLDEPLRRGLVGHHGARRGRLRRDSACARETVLVAGPGDVVDTYEFALRLVDEGRYEGCWLLTGVELAHVGEAPDFEHAPTVTVDGHDVECVPGDRLRDAVLDLAGVPPDDRETAYANCGGRGVCGTCAVRVEEDNGLSEATDRERRRLRFPPFRSETRLRLACQCRVRDDVTVARFEGCWDRHLAEYPGGGFAPVNENPNGNEADPVEVTPEEYEGRTDPPKEETRRLDLSRETIPLVDETDRLLGEDRTNR